MPSGSPRDHQEIAMKIGSFENKPLQPRTGDAKANAAEARASESSGDGQPSARVALSSTVTSLATTAGGDFDAAKVGRISSAIREGRFEVNAEAIADRLIAHTAELVGLRP
jgi:negative regulator of flagellin synthesis FlgM